MTATDTDAIFDIYVETRSPSESIALASTSATTAKGNGPSRWPSLSAAGLVVAFDSDATNLSPSDTDSTSDVYVKNLATGAITLASTTAAGVKGNGKSRSPSLSADGTKVAFLSHATNLDPRDTETSPDVYVKNLVTGDLTLVTVNSSGAKANDSAGEPVLAAGGGSVAFGSAASNLVPADMDHYQDVYVKNLVTSVLTLVSTTTAGVKGNARSLDPTISADGRLVAFTSDATNLDPTD